VDETAIAAQRAAVRDTCAALPEAEIRDGQHWALSVRGKRFAYHVVDHHGDGRVALHARAARGDNAALVASDPERFFLPPYLAHHGWVGLYTDGDEVDLAELRELIEDAYRLTAPKRLVARLDGPPAG
jgi:hypothetical protein